MRKSSTDIIFSHLPGRLRAPLERAAPFFEANAREIILRAELPVAVETGDGRYYLTEQGVLTPSYHTGNLLKTTFSDILTTFKSICDYSIYARQREINQGYVTIDNGVRVGVCGTAVISDGEVVNIKDITTLSFRVTSERIGCAGEILRKTDPLAGILLCGPPCSGKTTVLRDMARELSEQYKVSVIDERGELSGAACGRRGFDLGLSDVSVGMSKGDGVIRALRSLAPDIMICDELGGHHDAEMLRNALRCGAAFIAAVHARSKEDLLHREITAQLLRTDAFRYLVFLRDRHHAGEVRSIEEWRDIREAPAVYDGRRRVAGDRSLSLVASE